MTTIAFAPRTIGEISGERELLGVKATGIPREDVRAERMPVFTGSVATVPPPKPVPSEIEKAVRRMPVLYVIAFFGVVVLSAVMIIWNTLQVNKLTSERSGLDTQIAQNQQHLIRLRAEEMELSARDRIQSIAETKFGMVPATGQDIVTVK